jgi:hypothetical protein
MILEHKKNVGIVLVYVYGYKDHFGKRNYVKIIYRIKPIMKILKLKYFEIVQKLNSIIPICYSYFCEFKGITFAQFG